MIEILGEQREMTRDNVERKQARTEDERIEDEDDEFIEEEEEGKSSFSLKCPVEYRDVETLWYIAYAFFSWNPEFLRL